MPTVGFEPTILVRERPQTHTLDRTAWPYYHLIKYDGYLAAA